MRGIAILMRLSMHVCMYYRTHRLVKFIPSTPRLRGVDQWIPRTEHSEGVVFIFINTTTPLKGGVVFMMNETEMCSVYSLKVWPKCFTYSFWSILKSSYNMHFRTDFDADFCVKSHLVIIFMIFRNDFLIFECKSWTCKNYVDLRPPWLSLEYHYSFRIFADWNHSNICIYMPSTYPESFRSIALAVHVLWYI